MVNLSLSKKPEESWGGKCSCGSGKVRRFGLKGGPRTACINCKSDDMINLTTKICYVRVVTGKCVWETWWETGAVFAM